jgi:hypothetical protein
MDEDQLIAPPFEPTTPKRQTDAERIMARLAVMPTREDLWRAVLLGRSFYFDYTHITEAAGKFPGGRAVLLATARARGNN